MKKFKYLLILSILISYPQISFANKYGKGELKLSPMVVDYFIYYIRGKQFEYPSIFYVTLDGTDAVYWYCSERNNCRSGSASQERSQCMAVTGRECAAFARERIIKWKTDLNPGKGKISKINSKWSDQEIISHLTKLGFVD